MKRHDIEISDVEYSRPDGVPLLARLYRPNGDGPFPGLVEVHGGAWTANDRLTNEAIHVPVAEGGVVVLAIDFRMPPAARYPEPVADINLAMRWLKSKASDLDIAPEKIGILGTSSGGHQAMLSTLRPSDSRYASIPLPGSDTYDASAAFVALCWPIVDPLARYRMVKAKGNQRLVDAHDAYWPSEDAMAEGNPQLILESGEPGTLPPALLIQGTNDDNVTPDMAENFASAYRAAGGEIQLEIFEGQTHAFIAKDPEANDAVRAVGLIRDFVHAQTGQDS